jgi:Flp pilus assembly protein TadD
LPNEARHDTDEAEKAFRVAIQRDPRLAEAHDHLGLIQLSRVKLEDAVAAFREAIRLKPDDGPAYKNLGNALRVLGKFDEADAAFREAARLMPGSPAQSSAPARP